MGIGFKQDDKKMRKEKITMKNSDRLNFKRFLCCVGIVLLMFSTATLDARPCHSRRYDDSSHGIPNYLTNGYYVDNPDKIGSFGTTTISLARSEPGVEIISKRTPVARHFIKEGRNHAYLFTTPTSFMDYQGRWHDTELVDIRSSSKYLDSNWYGFTREVDNDGFQPVLWNYQTSVDGSYYPIVVGQDLDGWPWYDYFRGHVQWDTSSIPDDVQSIDSLKLNLYLPLSIEPEVAGEFDVYECDMDFYQMTYRPSDWGRGNPIGKVGDALWTDADDGNFYGYQYVKQGGNSYSVPLYSAARNDLKAQLPVNWFAIGFTEVTDQGDGTGTDRGISFWGGSNCYLEVEYPPPCDPQLSVTPTSLDFGTMCPGETAQKSFTVKNTGTCTLTWQASESCSWITSISPSSGSLGASQSKSVTVSISTSGLEYGQCYTCSISVTSNGGSQTVTVKVCTSPCDPQLGVTPTTLDFGTMCPGQTAQKPFTVRNDGPQCSTLTWQASESCSWITSVSPSSGSLSGGQSQSVTVSISTSGLSEGQTYTCSFSITSNDGSETVTVKVIIGTAVLYVFPTSLDFGTIDPGQTDQKSFTVRNDGDCSLQWQASETCSWITQIIPSSGTLNPGQTEAVWVYIDASGLEFDQTYTCSISITTNDGSETVTVTLTTSPPPLVEWTFIVYLDGDNDLESAGIEDFNEMEAAPSNPAVNIVVQFDRIPGYNSTNGDWTTTRRYLVTHDTDPSTISSTPISDLGELNMGDPATLVSFVEWTIQNYPANHYALVLWDHGSGWRYSGGVMTKGVCFDDSSGGDGLTMQELRDALNEININTGVKLDILGFDACLMGMLEVDYQIRQYADYRVGSEETEPFDGWNYEDTLTALTSNPSMSPQDLAKQIVTDYFAPYGTGGDETMSATNLNVIDNVKSAVDSLAQCMILDCDIESYLLAIRDCRQNTPPYADDEFVDLYDFARLVNQNPDLPSTTTDAANTLMNNLNNYVIEEKHGGASPESHGVSIYFPDWEQSYESTYDNLLFAQDTKWDEFLEAYRQTDTTDPVVEITYPSEGELVSALTIWINGTVIESNIGTNEPTIDDIHFDLTYWDSTTGEFGFRNNTAIPDGSISVSVTFIDMAGNTGSDTVSFVVQSLIGWDVILTASIDIYSDISDFGVKSDATGGFDSDYDDIDPPPPPIGVVSYFWYPDNPTTPVNKQKLSTSKIAPSPPLTWTYKVHPINVDGTIYISWSASDIANVPSEYGVHLHCLDGTVINMREATEYSFAAESCTTYTFIIRVGGCDFELQLLAGWNMVSFPCIPEDPSFSNIFNGVSYYQVLTWDGTSYITPTTAEAGIGYWVLVLEDTTVAITNGVPVESYELDLPAGWSMIGSIYPCTVDADCVFPEYHQLLTWDGTSYIDTSTIEPGKGYWALVLEPTHIVVDESCCITLQLVFAKAQTTQHNSQTPIVSQTGKFSTGTILGLVGCIEPSRMLCIVKRKQQ